MKCEINKYGYSIFIDSETTTNESMYNKTTCIDLVSLKKDLLVVLKQVNKEIKTLKNG